MLADPVSIRPKPISATEILKGEVKGEIFVFQHGDHLLEIVTGFSGHANQIPLDRGGDLEFHGANLGADGLGMVARDSLLELDRLTGVTEWGNVDAAILDVFEADIAFGQFTHEHLAQGLHSVLIFGCEEDLIVLVLDLGIAAFEVETS